MNTAPTRPPGPADEAALEFARRVAPDRSIAFWAEVERLASLAGIPFKDRT